MEAAADKSTASTTPEQNVTSQFLELTVSDKPQPMEAYDCSQGPGWHEGINKLISPTVSQVESSKPVATEAEQFNVIVGGTADGGGRTLLTGRTVPPGERVCPVTCMFFDDQGVLNTFLHQPGNEMYRGRVISIQNVHRSGLPVTI